MSAVRLITPVFTYRFSSDGPQLTVDMILEVTQLFCFPFAVDIAEDILQEVQQWVFKCTLITFIREKTLVDTLEVQRLKKI